MARSETVKYRRAGAPASKASRPFLDRWVGKFLLCLLSIVLLGLSFAPFKQFYLAWIGLVPWLIVVSKAKTPWRAFWWGYLGGVLFFGVNMWWIGYVTIPGAIALFLFLGLYWAIAGLLVRSLRLLGDPADPTPVSGVRRVGGIVAIPAIWVGLEWLRGSAPFEGIPWVYFGHTQTPVLWLCQIADIAGELGVTFWVVLVNALIAMVALNRWSLRGLTVPAATVGVITVVVLAYGWNRFREEAGSLSAGPVVMVVQPNIPQSNTGQKGEPLDKIVEWHLAKTDAALKQSPDVDLVVWSETVMPALNKELRLALRDDRDYGEFAQLVHAAVASRAKAFDSAILTGGSFYGRIETPPGKEPSIRYYKDSRNAAYYYERGSGKLSDSVYQKIHRVPFGEYIPFKESIPPLYRMLVSLGPPDMEDYQLTPGDPNNLTVYSLPDRGTTAGPGKRYRFVTPICFEDIDAALLARMFRPDSASNGGKRADLIINLTNDGWFAFNQMPQHLQAASFRSIENRAPTARAVNTGISGFVDSMGRQHALLAANTEGVSKANLRIDSRVTFFTRHGNVFAYLCAGVTGILTLIALPSAFRRKQVDPTKK